MSTSAAALCLNIDAPIVFGWQTQRQSAQTYSQSTPSSPAGPPSHDATADACTATVSQTGAERPDRPDPKRPGDLTGRVFGRLAVLRRAGRTAKGRRGTLFPAAAGIERNWKLKATHRSRRYTTHLTELPRVRA